VISRNGNVFGNRSSAALFLCYHSVADGGPPFLSVPVDVFEHQMHVFRRIGLKNGTLEDLRDLAEGRRLDAPRAFLTFDDGFADNHDIALPIMQEHGFLPWVYVLPPRLDDAGPLAWPEVAERQQRHPDVMRSMDWAQVERMAEAGAHIGSHTLSHPRLSRLDPEPLREELLESRRRVAERLGACTTIAYPFGDWSDEVAQAAGDVGYEFAFTVPRNGQRVGGPLSIPRIAVDHRDMHRRLRAKLTLAGRHATLSPVRPLLSKLVR
jgi:peptidoglycan/xylan/chitin deacetylase (PgdA/CDA1 family)